MGQQGVGFDTRRSPAGWPAPAPKLAKTATCAKKQTAHMLERGEPMVILAVTHGKYHPSCARHIPVAVPRNQLHDLALAKRLLDA